MDKDFDYEDYPLPHWAIGRCNGMYVLGAQLHTRDGRRCGNAHIIHIEAAPWDRTVSVHTVLTDAGNEMRLTADEINELFHPPKWISSVDGVIKRFKRIP